MSAPHVRGDETPEVDEMQGREHAYVAFPVRVEGPARIQQLPLKSGASRSIFPDLTEPMVLVKEDPTRARLLVWCSIGDAYVGWSQEAVRGGNAGLIFNGMSPVEFRSQGRLWVRSSNLLATVSYITEHWTL